LSTGEARWLLAILAAGALVRLLLFPTTAHLTEVFTDEFTFKRHVVFIHDRGLLDAFTDTNTSYVVYHYLLWLLSIPYGWLGGAFDTESPGLKVLVKLPPLLIDLATVLVAYLVAAQLTPPAWRAWGPLAIAALVAFHPVVVYDSAVWAQIDAVIALAAMGGIAPAAANRPALACAVLAVGLLTKPQPVIFGPVVAVLVLRTSGWSGLGKGAAAAAVVTIIPLLPWILTGGTRDIVDVYRGLFSNNNGVTALTQNAWNLWWFIPFETVPQSTDVMFSVGGVDVTYQRFSLGLSALAGALAVAYAWRFPDLRGGLMAASYIAVAFYVLPTSTHERYMYPFVILAAPLLLVDARMRFVYPVLSGTLFLNMVLVAPPVEVWMLRWDDALFTHYIAGLNVLVFGALTWMVASDIIWADEAPGVERQRRAETEAEAAR
jgi:hypothetical protein